jgi:hypothetical protein
VKSGPQLRIGLINEILSEDIFLTVTSAPWRFFRLAAILLLCRDAKFRWDTLWDDCNTNVKSYTEHCHAVDLSSTDDPALPRSALFTDAKGVAVKGLEIFELTD